MFEKLIQDTKKYFLFSGGIIIVILLLIIVIYLLSGMQGLYITLGMMILVFCFFLWMFYGIRYKHRERSPEEIRRQQIYDDERIRQRAILDSQENHYQNIQRERRMHPKNMGWGNLKNIFR